MSGSKPSTVSTTLWCALTRQVALRVMSRLAVVAFEASLGQGWWERWILAAARLALAHLGLSAQLLRYRGRLSSMPPRPRLNPRRAPCKAVHGNRLRRLARPEGLNR
jgi:hypothetical protein